MRRRNSERNEEKDQASPKQDTHSDSWSQMKTRIAPAPVPITETPKEQSNQTEAESRGDHLSSSLTGVKDPTKEDYYLANVFSFGWGEDGRLGLGEAYEKNHPFPHPVMALHWRGDDTKRVKSVACGGKHTLFLLNDQNGTVYSCGDNSQGALGWRSQGHKGWTPQVIDYGSMDKNDDRVVAVAAGHASSFVVTNRGEVYSWGSRMFGALGQDGEDNKDNEKKKANDRDREKKRAQEAEEGEKQEKNDKVVLAPRLITGLAYMRVSQISIMGYHVMAVTEDRRLFGWGRNQFGQLGIDQMCPFVEKPTQVAFMRNEKPLAVSAGWEHTLALVEVERTNGKKEKVVFAWGNPANGRLGSTDPLKHKIPQEVARLTAIQVRKKFEIKAVAAGGSHSLVLTSAGTMFSWGSGSYGQLGYGHLWDRMVPTPVLEVAQVTEIRAGYRHSLALQENNELWGWGWNGFGELGLGEVKVKLQPYCLFAFKRATLKAVYTGERHTIVVTHGMATKVVDEEAYKPYFSLMDDNRGDPKAKQRLKAAMEAQGLQGDYLDHRYALMPGQPGMCDEDVEIDEQKYGYKWCFDTYGKDSFLGRSSWPTRHRCETCKLSQVCMACARHCHKGHSTDPYIAVKKKGDKCDCASGKVTCVCRWSELRHEFDKMCPRDGEYLMGNQLRSLLGVVRFGKTFTVEDLEAAYQSLCLRGEGMGGEADPMLMIAQSKVTWFEFEEWYVDYFAAKDAPPVSLEAMMQTLGMPSAETPRPPTR